MPPKILLSRRQQLKYCYRGYCTIYLHNLQELINYSKKTCKQLKTELTSHTEGGDEMNNIELEKILKDKFDINKI